MNLLSADNLAFRIGERTLFEGLTFGIERGRKIGLVAKNGAGKSTLLSILAGRLPPDEGTVTLRGGVRLAYLEQDPRPPGGMTVLEWCLALDHPAVRAGEAYARAEASGDPARLQAAMEEMERTAAWDFPVRARRELDRLGHPDPDRPAATLSGGERKRAALARALLDDPQLLLLDEPTNHLDLDMIEWLEERLAGADLTILMVTHDRYFLERVGNEIVELAGGTLHTTRGGYEAFLAARSRRIAAEEKAAERERTVLAREIQWFSRAPKARGGRSKHRLEELRGLERAAGARIADRELSLSSGVDRLGKRVLELKGVTRGFAGRTLIRDLTYSFRRGERLGIVGPNGSGKTTLVRMLAGFDPPDAGTVERGANTRIGVFSQITPEYDGASRVLDVAREVAEVYATPDGRTVPVAKMLERFLFPAHTHGVRAGKLSGGERRRLHLLTILLANPNFLILDEPTNDLDLLTLAVLEEFLEEFPGCLAIVSHDRCLLDRLADHLFILDGAGGVTDFTGNWSVHRARLAALAEEERERSAPAPSPPSAAPRAKAAGRVRLTWAQERELESLEPELERIHAEASALSARIDAGELGYKELADAAARLEELRRLEGEKSDRWLELSAIAEEAAKPGGVPEGA